MVGRWILAPVVRVRVLAPQLSDVGPGKRGLFVGLRVVRRVNACNTPVRRFVRTRRTPSGRWARVRKPSDTNGPLWRAVTLSPTRRSRSESPAAGCLCHVSDARHDCDGARVDDEDAPSNRRGGRPHGETRPAGAALLRQPPVAAQRPAVLDRGEAAAGGAPPEPAGRRASSRA